MNGQSRAMRGSRAYDLNGPMKNRSATELLRVPSSIDCPIIRKDHACSDIILNRIRSRSHFKSSVRSADDGVDTKLGIDIRRESKRSVDANGLEFWLDHAIHGHRVLHRNQNAGSSSWQNAVLPSGGVRPVARSDCHMSCLLHRDQSHGRRMRVPMHHA